MGPRVSDFVNISASIYRSRTREITVAGVFNNELWDPMAVRVSRLLALLVPVSSKTVRLHIGFVLIAIIPSVLLAFSPSQSSIINLILWTFNCYGMLSFPWFTWRSLRLAGPGLDVLWSNAPVLAHDTFVEKIQDYLCNRRQIFTAIGMGTVTSAGFAIESGRGDWSILVLIAFFVVGAFVGYCGYLLIITALLCFRIARSTDLTLNFLAPYDTGGLRLSSEAMSRLSKLGLTLVVTFTAALYLRYVNLKESEPVWFTVGAVLAGLGFVTLIGVFSQRCLESPAADATRKQLQALESKVMPHGVSVESNVYAAKLFRSSSSRFLSDYAAKSSLRSTYTDANLITAYITAAFGVIVQLLLAGLGLTPPGT